MVTMSHNSWNSIKVDLRTTFGETLCSNQPAYKGARELRSGMSDILINPVNGSFSSKIK